MPQVFQSKPTTVQPTKTPSDTAKKVSTLSVPLHNLSIFSSFAQHPTNISFRNQEQDEEIVLFLRKHLITNVPWIITTIFLIVIPILFFGILQLSNTALSFLPQQYINAILTLYFIIVGYYVLLNFCYWFYNVSFMTTIRVIDLDYSDVVIIDVAATKVAQIKDVTYQQVGVIRSFFDYGDVFIRTDAPEAGTHVNFDFLAIPHPARATAIIHDFISEGGD